MRLRTFGWMCALAGFGLAGCTVGPNYRPPKAGMPDHFAAAANAEHAKAAADISQWWQTLNDAQLNALVDRAIRANLSLEIALTRLQEARTYESALTGFALPVVDATAAGAGGTGSDVTRSRTTPPMTSATNTKGYERISWIAGFDAFWEMDLFGKYRRAIEAARADSQAAAELRNQVLISVVADVARTYLDIRGLQMQAAVLQRNIDTAQRSLDLVQARYNRGIINELDVTLAQRQLATLKSQAAPIQSQINAARYALAVLLGEFPEQLGNELEQPGLLPLLPQEVEAGLPLDLLRRRPDVRAAERQLAAATARIGVATADLYPHVFISGSVGWQGQGLGVTPVQDKFIWSAGAGAIWPLLDFGTLDALVNVADLRTHEQLVGYKLTVQNAVREVDTAITNYVSQQDRLHNLGDALAASQRSVGLATQRYDRGLTDFLNVIDAERQQYDLELQYASAQLTVAEQYVALYKGLGGGWEQYQSIPAIRQPQPAVVAAFRRLVKPTDPLQ